MFLSCSAKKGTKEGGIGEALRKGALPYVPHPPHDCPTAENVPIFGSLPGANCQFPDWQVFKNRNIFEYRSAMRLGFPKGALLLVAPLWSLSFGTFLGETRKVRYPTGIHIFRQKHPMESGGTRKTANPPYGCIHTEDFLPIFKFAGSKSTGYSRFCGARGCSHLDGTK